MAMFTATAVWRNRANHFQEKHGENRQKAQKWLVFERLFKHNETYHVFQNKTDYSSKSRLSFKKKGKIGWRLYPITLLEVNQFFLHFFYLTTVFDLIFSKWKMNFKDIKLLREIEVIGKILWIRGQYGA